MFSCNFKFEMLKLSFLKIRNSDIFYKFISLEIGEKFGFDARNAMVTDEGGAEIDSIEVIRDNDKLFIVEDLN